MEKRRASYLQALIAGRSACMSVCAGKSGARAHPFQHHRTSHKANSKQQAASSKQQVANSK
eukprot:1918130-Rhodomonas_salina.2